MKKKQPTFSDRAKAIRAKYTRASWDKIERADMMKELNALREEQEAVRASMGEGQEQSYAMGGNYDGFNNSQYLPKTYSTNQSALNIKADDPNGITLNYSTLPSDKIKTDNIYGNSTAPVDINSNAWQPMTDKSLFNTSNKSIAPKESKYQLPSDSVAPFAISAGLSAIGDIAGLVNQKKNTPIPIQFPRIAPQNISLQPQREVLQRGYNTASNVMLRNSRDVSSPSNAYANQISGLSALTDSYGTQMGQSYMNEANANAEAKMNVATKNADIGMQETMQNAKFQDQYNQTTNAYINSLSNTIPSALRDYRQQVNQTNMLNIMGKDFGMYTKYNPNQNSWQKFVAGIKGPQYSILNRYYANQNLV